MKKYIIVKYAEEFWPKKKAPYSCHILGSYSAQEIGGVKEYYLSKKEAEPDLKKLQELNPTVGYGIVEALDT